MLLALTVCNLFVLTIANPFHKYPFVFLLDVGNEELEKTNTEQIRISVPGGSIALRYPAVGDGDTIGHVRVSGIDFGTDLKANIIDGGPGSKYVLLVFMGNSGVPYDAVITVQTVSNDKIDLNIQQNTGENAIDESEENDSNNSAEDISEASGRFKSPNQFYVEKKNAQLTQSSSNVYAYTQNEVINSDDFNEGKEFESVDDINNPYDSIDQKNNLRVKDYAEDDGEPNEISSPEVEVRYRSDSENDDEIHADEEQSAAAIPDKVSEDSDLDKDTHIETQSNDRGHYSEDSLDYEDPVEIEQLFNDEETQYDGDKYKDLNNNDYDNDDSFAVAS